MDEEFWNGSPSSSSNFGNSNWKYFKFFGGNGELFPLIPFFKESRQSTKIILVYFLSLPSHAAFSQKVYTRRPELSTFIVHHNKMYLYILPLYLCNLCIYWFDSLIVHCQISRSKQTHWILIGTFSKSGTTYFLRVFFYDQVCDFNLNYLQFYLRSHSMTKKKVKKKNLPFHHDS